MKRNLSLFRSFNVRLIMVEKKSVADLWKRVGGEVGEDGQMVWSQPVLHTQEAHSQR